MLGLLMNSDFRSMWKDTVFVKLKWSLDTRQEGLQKATAKSRNCANHDWRWHHKCDHLAVIPSFVSHRHLKIPAVEVEALCRLVAKYRRLRSTCCIHYQGYMKSKRLFCNNICTSIYVPQRTSSHARRHDGSSSLTFQENVWDSVGWLM